MEEAGMMTLYTIELEGTDCHDVDYLVEDELAYNEIMNTFFLHEDPSVRLPKNYMTRCEVEKLMEDNIRTTFPVVTPRVFTDIVEEMIENAFRAGFDVKNEGIKTTFLNMMAGALVDIVEQGRVDTILNRNLDNFVNSGRSMDSLTPWVVGSKSLVSPITFFVKNQVNEVAQKARFEHA